LSTAINLIFVMSVVAVTHSRFPYNWAQYETPGLEKRTVV